MGAERDPQQAGKVLRRLEAVHDEAMAVLDRVQAGDNK